MKLLTKITSFIKKIRIRGALVLLPKNERLTLIVGGRVLLKLREHHGINTPAVISKFLSENETFDITSPYVQ